MRGVVKVDKGHSWGGEADWMQPWVKGVKKVKGDKALGVRVLRYD